MIDTIQTFDFDNQYALLHLVLGTFLIYSGNCLSNNHLLGLLEKAINNMLNAIEQGIITPSTKQRLETLEVTKRELEDKILIENMKRPLRTEDELWAWFRYMRNFDLTRLEERRQLIDVFVNTVFLYNDRFLLTLNFGYGSKTVLFTDIPCSDKVACGDLIRIIRTLTFSVKRSDFLCS